MARKSVIARQAKREALVLKYAAKRAALKKNRNYQDLDQLPRNSSKVRLRNRCKLTGRARGYMRYFGVSRLVFRDLASDGKVPGVKKASW